MFGEVDQIRYLPVHSLSDYLNVTLELISLSIDARRLWSFVIYDPNYFVNKGAQLYTSQNDCSNCSDYYTYIVIRA